MMTSISRSILPRLSTIGCGSVAPIANRAFFHQSATPLSNNKNATAVPTNSLFDPKLKIPHVHGSTADFQWNIQKKYTGPIKAVILDWAGTVCDCGVYSPAVVFIDIFERFGVPITMEEARLPMGAHKKVHIRKITQIPSVRARWTAKYNRSPNEEDVEKMFEQFVPAQLAVLPKYTAMITGAVDTVKELQKKRGLKIGSTTGFTTPMVEILKQSAAKDGYVPDCYVAADDVPAARPYPFMVWLNAIKLGISPAVSIVKVDDTADGVSEGVTAGVWSVGLAETGNYMGMTEAELKQLKKNDPEEYERRLMKSYETLAQAGAHYVINDITGLPAVIDKINARLARGEHPYSGTA